MTPEQAEAWVTTFRFGAHVGHGWSEAGDVFPFGIRHTRAEAITDVLNFSGRFGEPPAKTTKVYAEYDAASHELSTKEKS